MYADLTNSPGARSHNKSAFLSEGDAVGSKSLRYIPGNVSDWDSPSVLNMTKIPEIFLLYIVSISSELISFSSSVQASLLSFKSSGFSLPSSSLFCTFASIFSASKSRLDQFPIISINRKLPLFSVCCASISVAFVSSFSMTPPNRITLIIHSISTASMTKRGIKISRKMLLSFFFTDAYSPLDYFPSKA